jgi:tetratricopeptide (TPR) repeat protein
MNLQKGDTLSALTSLNALLKRYPNIPQAYLLLASAHSARNDFDSAFQVYSRMREVFPKSPEVPFFTAGLLARQNRLDDARKQCEASLQLSTNYLPAIELLVDLDLNQHKYDSAMSRVNTLGQAQPKAAEPRLLAAKVYLAQTNYPKAEEALLQTIELNPENPKAYLWLAQIHVRSGQHAEALRRLNTLVSRTNDVTALMQIGIIHETLQNVSDASETYEKILQVNPRFSPALNNLAYIYADKLNDPSKALPLAERARQLLPYNPAAADTLGWVLFRKGDYTRAFGLLQNAASQLANENEVQYHLGMAGYMLGEEDVAEAAFSRAIQATNSPAFLSEAKTRLATLKLEATPGSLEKVQTALKENPSDPIALSRLADIHMGEKKFEDAADAYQAVLKATPQNARVKLKLAQLYAGPLKDPVRALAFAKEAYASMPGDPNVMRILGRLAFDSGDHTWSASLLQEAARKTSEDPELQHQLAWALYANGNISGSLDAMRSAAQAPDTAPFKADARRFIQFVQAFSDPTQLAALKSSVAQALSADPDYVPALMLSAKASQSAGDADTATKLFNQVIAKYPNFTPAAREIAILAGDKPSVDPKAFELGLRARQAYPQDPQLARALGIMSFRQNDFSRAVQYLQESTRANPKDSEALYYLGSSQFRLKSNKEAKTILQQALALNLPQNLADEAKHLLAQMK